MTNKMIKSIKMIYQPLNFRQNKIKILIPILIQILSILCNQMVKNKKKIKNNQRVIHLPSQYFSPYCSVLLSQDIFIRFIDVGVIPLQKQNKQILVMNLQAQTNTTELMVVVISVEMYHQTYQLTTSVSFLRFQFLTHRQIL